MSETNSDTKSQEENDSPEVQLAKLNLDNVEELVDASRQDGANPEGSKEEPDGNNMSEDLNGDEVLVGSNCHLGLDEEELEEEDLEIQQWSDGSSYKGHMDMNLKGGCGKFKWANGEIYVGEFYKDHHHGKGIYTWPDGSKFTGSFYLSRKEGYGTMTFTDGRKYQGLYKADSRFGPGIETYSDGCQDVGIWMGHHLFRLCTLVPGSVTISSFPEFCPQFNEDLRTTKYDSSELPERQLEDPFEFRYKILLEEDSFTLPDKIYSYSLDTDHLPITRSQHTEFDSHFYRDSNIQEESDNCTSDSVHTAGNLRDVYLHVIKHRNTPEHFEWQMCSVMRNEREKFGPKGPRECSAERLIEMAGLGDLETVSTILRHDLAHVDVSDSSGLTALHAATVNGHNNIINLLLDNGADVNKTNDEGLSALSLCLMLFYSTKSFWSNVAERNFSENKEGKDNLILDSIESESCVVNEDIEKTGEMSPVSDESLHYKIGASLESEEEEAIVDHHRNKNLRPTMNLLLLRGADPNLSTIPMNALFFAVKAADVSSVQLLLECGARTDVRLKTQGETNSVILGFSMKGGLESGLPLYNYFDKTPCVPEEGGRTPLHVACEREDNYKFARDIVSLLLAHNAKHNTLWSGHSPLSLAIASGNDLAVKELLANGADPNLALSRGVGSALCAAVNIAYEKKRTLAARIALVDRLIKAGANILMPIVIGAGKRTVLGTATDYAYFKYFQDKKIAHTPYHALLPEERDIYNARKQLLEHLGKLTREAALAKEQELVKEGIVRETHTKASMKMTAAAGSTPSTRTFFKYCYQCGRSIGVKLTPCLRCYSVYTCSKLCKKRSWDEIHRDECQQLTGKLSGKISPTGRGSSKVPSAKGRKSSPAKHLHAEKESSGRDAYGDCIPSTSENYSYN
ncbi:ankyrin repeat and MYND domain-containing protein 1 [Leptodactylus fuscus]|uniref:ankyrin repeat and MYND domain-containing protein 1 n=1 Tax=Leptodactylus fuscus TaxID=238119 RepID=UPI003F4EC854